MSVARGLFVPLALTILSLVMVGCSNGGSSSSGAPPSVDRAPSATDDPASATVSGAATKGVMQFSRVSAYELDDAARRVGQVAETETDEEGFFELSLGEDYEGGFLEIVVSVQDDTRMICDAPQCGDTPFGSALSLPDDLTLHTFSRGSKLQGKTFQASASVWTTMAVERSKALMAQGLPFIDALRQAEAEINELLGFPFRSTQSRGLSQLSGASSEEVQYAVLNAAAAEILFNGGFSTEAFRNFTRAMNDGRLDADDSFTPWQLAVALEGVLSRHPVLDYQAMAALNNLAGRLAAIGEDGFVPGYDEDLVVDEGSSDLEKIKAFQRFISQVRSWVGVLEDLDGDALEQAVTFDSDTIAKLVDEGSQTQLKFLGELIEQTSGYIAYNIDEVKALFPAGGETQMPFRNWEGEQVADVTLRFTNDKDGFRIDMIGRVAGTSNTLFLPFHFALISSADVDDLMSATVDSFPTVLAGSKLSLTGTIHDGRGDSILRINQASVDLNPHATHKSASTLRSLKLAGEVGIENKGASFTGRMELGLMRLNDDAVWHEGLDSVPVSVSSLKLSGDFSAPGGISTRSTVVLNIRNAPQIDMISWLEDSGDHRYITVPLQRDEVDALTQLLFPVGALIESAQARIDMNTAPVQGTLGARAYDGASSSAAFMSCIASPDAVKSECAEDHLASLLLDQTNAAMSEDFKQWLKRVVEQRIARHFGNDMELASQITAERVWLDLQSNAELIPGARLGINLRLPEFRETRDRFLDASFTLSSRVNIPELHSAQLTATINRSSLRGGSIVANMAAEGRSYSLVISSDDIDMPGTVELRFFNAQGYALNMEVGLRNNDIHSIKGKALIGDKVVGKVELRDDLPIIVYPNGDESLFESLL